MGLETIGYSIQKHECKKQLSKQQSCSVKTLTRNQLILYLRERFQSSKHKDDTYKKFHDIRQVKSGPTHKISIIAPDLLMHRSRLPEDTISEYAFIQQFFESMHHRLRQD